MRIAIFSPYSKGPMRGNMVTVQRIASALADLGQLIHIFHIDDLDISEMGEGLTEYAPDVILAFHAYHCGESACREARRLQVPCIVIITGSDISEAQYRDHCRTRFAMDMAEAVVCFDENLAAFLLTYFPSSQDRLYVIPQGVECLSVSGIVDNRVSDDAYVVLLPAALRPVKNVEEALNALSPLADKYPRLRFVIAGGVIDRVYADVVCEMLKDAPYAVWLGEVPHDRMGALYMRAEVVLNCSLYEGMPNSLLEAMALGRPVLAADIPGNRSLVHDNQTGWLYHGPTELTVAVERLMNNPGICSKVGQQAREMVQSRFLPQMEANRYIELCTTLRLWPRLDNRERC